MTALGIELARGLAQATLRKTAPVGLANAEANLPYIKKTSLALERKPSTGPTSDVIFEAGMELYWWNPLYDDYDAPHSHSRRVQELTNVPCMVTGGNVGSSAFVFAAAVLRASKVALVGFDMSYAPGTPALNTQYYYQLR